MKSNEDFILPDQNINKIIYSEIGTDSIIYSSEIPFSSYETNDGYQIDFLFRRWVTEPNYNASFKLSYFLENGEVVEMDSSIYLYDLTSDDIEEFFSFENFDAVPDNYWPYDYDIADSSIFILYFSLGVYEYNLFTHRINHLIKKPTNYIATNGSYLFYGPSDSGGYYRYNLRTSTTDMKLDLSQLEFDSSNEQLRCYAMSFFSDTLALFFLQPSEEIYRLSYFDSDGNYLNTVSIDPFKLGHLTKGIARYGNWLFYWQDTGPNVYNQISNSMHQYYIPVSLSNGCTRIRDNYYYFLNEHPTYSNQSYIGRIPIDKVLKVIYVY